MIGKSAQAQKWREKHGMKSWCEKTWYDQNYRTQRPPSRFFAICSTKRAVSCLPVCKMNCILAGGFAVSVQQYQFLCKLSGAMTSVTNIHHFSDGDVRQGLRISFGQLGFANHDQPSAPAFAIRARHKQKATNFLSSVAPQNLFQPNQRSVHLRTHNVHMPVAARTTLASSILGSGLGSELAWL